MGCSNRIPKWHKKSRPDSGSVLSHTLPEWVNLVWAGVIHLFLILLKAKRVVIGLISLHFCSTSGVRWEKIWICLPWKVSTFLVLAKSRIFLQILWSAKVIITFGVIQCPESIAWVYSIFSSKPQNFNFISPPSFSKLRRFSLIVNSEPCKALISSWFIWAKSIADSVALIFLWLILFLLVVQLKIVQGFHFC